MSRFLKINVLRKMPAIALMAIIFALSALPGDDPLLNAFKFSDKIKHFIAYFVLGLSFCLWVPNRNWFAKALLWGFLVTIFGIVFGIFNEYLQSFIPGRSGNDWGDVIANSIGATLAPIVYFIGIKIFSIFSAKCTSR